MKNTEKNVQSIESAEPIKAERVTPWDVIRKFARGSEKPSEVIRKAYGIPADVVLDDPKKLNENDILRALAHTHGALLYVHYSDTVTDDITRQVAALLTSIEKEKDPDRIGDVMDESGDVLKRASHVSRIVLDPDTPTRSYLMRNLADYETEAVRRGRKASAEYLADEVQDAANSGILARIKTAVACMAWNAKNTKTAIAKKNNKEAIGKIDTAVLTDEQKAAYEAFLKAMQA